MGPVAFDSEKDKLFFGAGMKNFDAVSVRETGLQTMLAEEFSVTAAKVCDPTLLLSREEWAELIARSRQPETSRQCPWAIRALRTSFSCFRLP